MKEKHCYSTSLKGTVLFLLLTLSLHLGAQLPVHLHLHSGLSVPVFDYASEKLDKGSYTSAGFAAGITVDARLYASWFLMIQGGMQLHPVKVGILGYDKVQADPFLLDVTIRSEPYKMLHALAGPAYNWQIAEKLRLQAGIMGGVLYAASPHQLYKPTYFMTGPDYYEITSSTDYSAAFAGSLRLMYAITPCYEIGLNADAVAARAGFRFFSAAGLRTDWRNISFLNLNAALVFRIPATQ